MTSFLKKYFSSENKASRLENKLQKAISNNNQQEVTSIFCKEVILLLNEKKAQLLSDFISSYLYEIQDFNSSDDKITAVDFKEAIDFLKEH